MANVTINLQGNTYTTQVQAGKHSLIADEPVSIGGDDKGATPSDLLLASLGSCTAITVRMYAKRKEWDLQAISIDLRFVKDADGNTTIKKKIDFKGDLDADQKKRLMIIADKCPVHKLLKSELAIESTLETE